MALTLSGTSARRKLDIVFERLTRLACLWIDDVLTLVPATRRDHWGRALGLHGPIVVVAETPGECREVGGSESSSLTEMRDRAGRRLLALRIDDGQLLRRKLNLPSAAMARLDAALKTNLSTWTPFTPEEVYAAAHPLEQTRSLPGAVRAVELRCVRRAVADERIAAMRALGLDPDAIQLGDARFTLARKTQKRASMLIRRWVLTGLALLLFSQGVGVYAILTSRQRNEIESLETARTEMVIALRRRADSEKNALTYREGLRKIAARMNPSASFTQALETLASAMSQGAVVRELELGRDRAEGHVAIFGTAGLDVAGILSRTGFYAVKDLNVLPGNDPDRKVFSVGFAVTPWVQFDVRTSR